MNDKIWLGLLAALCFVFGLAKALYPQFFLELRRKHRWIPLFDIYDFLYKSDNAEKIVRINGYLLLAGAIIVVIAIIVKK